MAFCARMCKFVIVYNGEARVLVMICAYLCDGIESAVASEVGTVRRTREWKCVVYMFH
ncbi:hypothetical protein AAC03nite_33710 [Alicyclobacillus acidoterrestris]|nr:hypothetical protein N007_17065 [Alicyclobacillus acidoterrestris ATCC 49025]GEO27586.1 hypothetical protein AAC03nite_33710 [Alicyclobacillus acidoterrestris]